MAPSFSFFLTEILVLTVDARVRRQPKRRQLSDNCGLGLFPYRRNGSYPLRSIMAVHEMLTERFTRHEWQLGTPVFHFEGIRGVAIAMQHSLARVEALYTGRGYFGDIATGSNADAQVLELVSLWNDLSIFVYVWTVQQVNLEEELCHGIAPKGLRFYEVLQ